MSRLPSDVRVIDDAPHMLALTRPRDLGNAIHGSWAY